MDFPGAVVNNVFHFPPITTAGAIGRDMTWTVKVWAACPDSSDPVPFPVIESGTSGAGLIGCMAVDSGYVEGKVRDSAVTRITGGKNIGRKNETSPLVQTMKEAHSKWKKQTRVSPGKPVEANLVALPPPMLAAREDLDRIVWPALVQPKLDGLRSLFSASAGFTSRTSIAYAIAPAIVEEARRLFDKIQIPGTLALDGELYIPGQNIQDINHIVRGSANSTHFEKQLAGGLQYHVYDIMNLDQKLIERISTLESAYRSVPDWSWIRLVPTEAVKESSELHTTYRAHLAAGWEGTMIRNPLSLYQPAYKNFRTRDLMKMKPALDEEFRIVGWHRATIGKTDGCLMIRCATDTGIEFNVTPAFTIPERIKMANDMEHNFDKDWCGRPLIVQFAQKSKDGVPLQPRTLMVVREWD